MTKTELTIIFHRIAVSDNAESKRQLIMQSMTPLMQADSVADGGRVTRNVQLSIADGGRQHLAPMSIKYIVAAPAVIEVAWRKAFAGRLQLEPSTKIECDDATVAGGVIALLSGRPVLTLVVSDDDALEMRIGGFQRSRVYHPGNLMDLSQQMIETGGTRRRSRQ